VADERDTEAYRHRGDSSIAVMDLVAKGVTRLLTPVAEIGVGHGVVDVRVQQKLGSHLHHLPEQVGSGRALQVTAQQLGRADRPFLRIGAVVGA
jgi:hypothetical protein